MKARTKRLFLLPALLVGLVLMLAYPVTAQIFTTLHNFAAVSDPYYTNASGANPEAGLVISGNTLYGTTSSGGSSGYGTVFKVNSDGTRFTNLLAFTDGNGGEAGLTLSGSTLFGTTSSGGISGYGAVFAVNTDGTGFTNLHSFTATDFPGFTNSDGANPQAALLLSGTTLFGTALEGGSSGRGTVFKVNADGTGFTNLHSFTATFTNSDGAFTNSDGASPYAGLILSGNTLFGTASGGGSSGAGTVFAVHTDGTGFTNLHSFTATFTNSFGAFTNSDGAFPQAALLLSGTSLFGTALEGGSSGRGTVFKVNTDGSGFTNLHSFTGGYDGDLPSAGLTLLGTTLYGTASGGGTNGNGTVFAVNTDGSGFTNLYDFTALDLFTGSNNDGANPYAGLILSGTTLFGAASGGGTSGSGTIFSLSLSPPPFTTLHSFGSIFNDGHRPQAGLVLSGNTLYGAADSGGSWDVGAVFAINTDGTDYTSLYDLTAGFNFSSPDSTNADGAYPDVTLVLSGSTLYGAAYWGGTNGNGTVFRVNTNGTGFAALHSFSAGSGSFPFNYTNTDGANPEAGLVISGNTLYGTAEHGGGSGYGAVFKVNTDGTGFTNLHSFTGGSDGEIPESLLLSGSTLYGSAIGFLSGQGTVFKLNTDGTGFAILHTFTATNFAAYTNNGPGSGPIYSNSDGVIPTGLTLSGDTLYGTAYGGGAHGNGTVFALNTNGTGFTILHSFAASFTNSDGAFTNSEGTHPIAFSGLVLSGNTLYGTAYYGGSSGNGTVFALFTNGVGFTTLHDFTAMDPVTGFNQDGANPEAGLLVSGNTLYGTTKKGGSAGDGTVFRLRLSAAPPQLTIFRLGADVVLTWPASAAGFTLQSSTNLVPPASWTTNSPAPVVVNGHNTVTNPVSGTRKFYRLIQ